MKKLFCRHIWKVEKDFSLNKYRNVWFYDLFSRELVSSTSAIWARKEVCVKCRKERFTQYEK